MHEASIAQSLLEQIQTILPAGSALRAVHIDIGELEHIDGTVLEAAWAGLVERTGLTGSVLCMSWTPMRVRCRACDREYMPEDKAILICPDCGAARPRVMEGSGILLRALDVDEPAANTS